MEPLAHTREFPAYFELAEAREGHSAGVGLAALLIMLTPFAVAAWFAIGVALYRVVS